MGISSGKRRGIPKSCSNSPFIRGPSGIICSATLFTHPEVIKTCSTDNLGRRTTDAVFHGTHEGDEQGKKRFNISIEVMMP